MASAEHQLPICPVCNQADQVKTTQAAYNSGVALAAPPDLPTKQVSMMPYIGTCIVIVGIFVFCVLVFIGGLENNLPLPIMLTIAVLTILSILTALTVSYISFQRVVKGDNDVAVYYPAYDEAMKKWSDLYYCTRDNVVFDPQAHKTLSQEQMTKLRAFTSNAQAQYSAAVSH